MEQYIPLGIQKLIAKQKGVVTSIGCSGATVIIYNTAVLKIMIGEDAFTSEVKILKWLEGKISVPKVLSYVVENNVSYLLMSRIFGEMAVKEEYLLQPNLLIKRIAKAIKSLWEVDIKDCPVINSIDERLQKAKNNIINGKVDIEDFTENANKKYGFKSPDELLQWLHDNRPSEELCFSHGDLCLPNIFFNSDDVSLIDFDQAGVADKWQDIAICCRSLCDNFNGKYQNKTFDYLNLELLYKELGVEPDYDKIKYFILLDELY